MTIAGWSRMACCSMTLNIVRRLIEALVGSIEDRANLVGRTPAEVVMPLLPTLLTLVWLYHTPTNPSPDSSPRPASSRCRQMLETLARIGTSSAMAHDFPRQYDYSCQRPAPFALNFSTPPHWILS